MKRWEEVGESFPIFELLSVEVEGLTKRGRTFALGEGIEVPAVPLVYAVGLRALLPLVMFGRLSDEPCMPDIRVFCFLHGCYEWSCAARNAFKCY